MKLKEKNAFLKRAHAGWDLDPFLLMTEKKISRQDQDSVHSVIRTHYVHVSMCSHVLCSQK